MCLCVLFLRRRWQRNISTIFHFDSYATTNGSTIYLLCLFVSLFIPRVETTTDMCVLPHIICWEYVIELLLASPKAQRPTERIETGQSLALSIYLYMPRVCIIDVARLSNRNHCQASLACADATVGPHNTSSNSRTKINKQINERTKHIQTAHKLCYVFSKSSSLGAYTNLFYCRRTLCNWEKRQCIRIHFGVVHFMYGVLAAVHSRMYSCARLHYVHSAANTQRG